MKTLKRAAALLLVCAICAAGFTSCFSSPVVLTIDGTNVTQARFNYYCRTILKGMENSAGYEMDPTSEISDGTTLSDVLKESAYKQILKEYAVLRLARENNVTLTDDEKATVKKNLESTKASFASNAEYVNYLNGYGIDDGDYLSILEDNALMNKTYLVLFNDGGAYELTDEEKAKSLTEYKDIFVNVEHIFLSLVDRDGNAVTSTVESQQKQLALSAYAESKDGTDFESLIQKYSDDKASEAPYNVYVKQGDSSIPTGYLTTAFALEEGQVSDVIKTTLGFYIIKRLPFDSGFNEYAYDEARNAKIELVVSDTTEVMPVVKADAYYSFTVS